MAAVQSQPQVVIPKHLRDAHYKGAEALGHVGYKFPHNDPRGWVEQEYVPGLRRGTYYQSDARSGATFEGRADEFWKQVTGKVQPKTFG